MEPITNDFCEKKEPRKANAVLFLLSNQIPNVETQKLDIYIIAENKCSLIHRF